MRACLNGLKVANHLHLSNYILQSNDDLQGKKERGDRKATS